MARRVHFVEWISYCHRDGRKAPTKKSKHLHLKKRVEKAAIGPRILRVTWNRVGWGSRTKDSVATRWGINHQRMFLVYGYLHSFSEAELNLKFLIMEGSACRAAVQYEGSGSYLVVQCCRRSDQIVI